MPNGRAGGGCRRIAHADIRGRRGRPATIYIGNGQAGSATITTLNDASLADNALSINIAAGGVGIMPVRFIRVRARTHRSRCPFLGEQ